MAEQSKINGKISSTKTLGLSKSISGKKQLLTSICLFLQWQLKIQTSKLKGDERLQWTKKWHQSDNQKEDQKKNYHEQN